MRGALAQEREIGVGGGGGGLRQRQADRQTDRQTGKQAGRQAGRQTVLGVMAISLRTFFIAMNSISERYSKMRPCGYKKNTTQKYEHEQNFEVAGYFFRHTLYVLYEYVI